MKETAFGKTLRRLRIGKSISQEKLALKSGLHRTYISQLERGIKNPSLATMQKLCRVLGIEFSQLAKLIEDKHLKK